MSEQEVFEKFEANASRALPRAQVDRLWERGLRLESSDSMKSFTELLSH